MGPAILFTGVSFTIILSSTEDTVPVYVILTVPLLLGYVPVKGVTLELIISNPAFTVEVSVNV